MKETFFNIGSLLFWFLFFLYKKVFDFSNLLIIQNMNKTFLKILFKYFIYFLYKIYKR
jgi:hypothetical protein